MLNMMSLFRRNRRGSTRSARRRRRGPGQFLESLERRLALAFSVIEHPVSAGQLNWATVLVDEGQDVYVQEVNNSDNDLFIANNASFFPVSPSGTSRVEIPNFSSRYNNLSVRSGREAVSSGNIETRVWDEPDNQELSATTVSFTLNIPSSEYSFESQDLIDGQLEYEVGDQKITVNFGASIDGSVGTTLAYEPTGGEFPRGFFQVSFTAQGDQIRVTLSESTESPIFEFAEDVRLTRFEITELFPSGDVVETYGLSGNVVGVRASSPTAIFSLPELASVSQYRYVPGTLQGSLYIDAIGGFDTTFQIASQEIGGVGNEVPLTFGANRAGSAVFSFRTGHSPTLPATYTVTGDFNTETGQIRIFTSLQQGNSSTRISLPVRLVDYRLGVRHASDKAATTFTLFDGRTFTTGLTVDLVNPGSAIAIESPLVTAGSVGGQGLVSLAATEVRLNAPLRASRQLRVPVATQTDGVWPIIDSGTVTERVEINAAVSSSQIELQLADEDDTVLWPRSQLIVTQSGSLLGNTDVLSPGLDQVNAVPADTIFIEVDSGDAYIEGQSVGTNQSIIMRSPEGEESLSPYLLTTVSRLTGAPTGRVAGDTVVITLANDGFGEDFSSYASSAVDLTTAVNRLRVQAANREGDVLSEPFDYSLNIAEQDGLIVDGVAAASGPISIVAGESLSFLAAIETRGDVSVSAGAAFTVNAPITTAFGAIAVEATSVTVNGQVRVLDTIAASIEGSRDISLVATDGLLTLNDAVSAINTVRLESRSVLRGAGVGGSARIRSDIVDIESDGNVTLLTDASLVKVRSPGIVSLEDDGAVGFEVRDSPVVTLVSNGVDAYIGGDRSPALYADIYDTQTLVVSAENGSIDVVHYGDNNLSVGNRSDIALGGEQVMQAAGSVSIRSILANEVIVYDAPISNSSAHAVRLATSASLDGEYLPGAPGLTPTAIITSITATAEGKLSAFDDVVKTDLRVGDDVLVKDGLSSDSVGTKANGIYAVGSITFKSATEVEVVLLRRTAFDTSTELEGPLFVRVAEGLANGGKVFVTEGFVIDQDNERNIPFVARSVPSQTGYLTAVAIAARADLKARFKKNDLQPVGDEIESLEPQSIRDPSVKVLFDGVDLFKGNRVVIQNPIQKYDLDGVRLPGFDEFSVGVYEVTAEGSETTKWELKRWKGVDEDGDGLPNTVYEGVVAITAGGRATARTGEMVELAYLPLNLAKLPFREINADEERLDLGTQNPTGTVVYEVSSERGRNDASGSFGKMLRLLQENDAVVERNNPPTPQVVEFQIGNAVRVIELEQALPEILEPIVIDPSLNNPDPTRRLFLDGTSIQYLANGRPVQAFGLEQIYAPVQPSKVKTARRLVRGVGGGTGGEIHGLSIGPTASGAIVRNLTVGGFVQGAAVSVAGATNVLIDNLVAGQSFEGQRLRNKWGVQVVQGLDGGGSEYTTISNSIVTSSTDAGILLGTGSKGVRLVGNTIGRDQQGGNTVGIRVDSESETASLIGVASFEMDGPDARFIRGKDPLRGRQELTLEADNDEVFKGLYIGQSISSTEAGVLAGGTTIQKIVRSPNGIVTLTLSKAINGSRRGVIPLAFGASAINTVVGNIDGIVVDSGAVQIANTEVSDSVFDGIILNGNNVKRNTNGQDVLFPEGFIRIGGQVGPEGAETAPNVGVTSNGQHGIRIAEGMWKHLNDCDPSNANGIFNEQDRLEKFQHIMNYLVIEGNRLGTDVFGTGRFSNGEFGDRNIWVDDDTDCLVQPAGDAAESIVQQYQLDKGYLRDLFLVNPEPNTPARDNSGFYKAPYRPEDGLDENGDPLPTDPNDPGYIDFFQRLNKDRRLNLHRTGEVGDGTGPGPDPEGPDPELRPGVPY